MSIEKASWPDQDRPPSLSPVVPVYKQDVKLPEFHRRLAAVLDGSLRDSEILFVNDGSSDASVETIGLLRTLDSRVALLELSRNFGKEAAMSAGLAHVIGDAVIVIDADPRGAMESQGANAGNSRCHR